MSIRDLQCELARLCALAVGQGMTLAPKFYTSAEWLSLERKNIFRREWVCVGRSDEIPSSGDFFTCEIDGASIIVVRKADAHLGAMSGVCLHRMALIAQGSGNTRGFTCPYHGWTYDLNGRLRSAPRMPADFDRSERSLPKVAIEEWNGFIYLNLDVTAVGLAAQLTDLDLILHAYHVERMRTLRRERHVWNTNWKILVENFLEPYHLNMTHAATLARLAAPSGVTLLPASPRYQFHRHRMLDSVMPVPLDERIGIPNADLTDEKKSVAYIGGIFPSHLFSVTWDSVFWLSLQPVAVDRVVVDWGVAGPFAIPHGETPDPEHPNLYYLQLAEAVNAEDRARVESVQKGASSGFAMQSALHPHEAPIQGFISYLHARLGALQTPP